MAKPIVLLLLLTVVSLGVAALPPSAAANPLMGVQSIDAGTDHTCVLTANGGVKCWGDNQWGQLGDSSPAASRGIPVDVDGLPNNITDVAAGGTHSCALAAGGVKCWGDNQMGELGDGGACGLVCLPQDVCEQFDQDSETCTALLRDVSAVESGLYHSCAATNAGAAMCWGNNEGGQLGDGTFGDLDPLTLDNIRRTPVQVLGLTSGVVAVTTGGLHSCALTDAGGVKCWGLNRVGELGDGGACGNPCPAPVDVTGLQSGVAAVSAGFGFTCALLETGGVKCWGVNAGGELGDGTYELRRTPVDVAGLDSGVAAVSAGAVHTCALTKAGAALCWGTNGDGQLGDGTKMNAGRNVPGAVLGLDSGVAAIEAGWSHTCALISNGGVKCWGYNFYGAIGTGWTTCEPIVFWCPSPVDVVLEPKSTRTPMPSATPTPTATPAQVRGDASCDGTVDSRDALLVLQLAAGMTPALPCMQGSDADQDGRITSLDAALILQHAAGLIALS